MDWARLARLTLPSAGSPRDLQFLKREHAPRDQDPRLAAEPATAEALIGNPTCVLSAIYWVLTLCQAMCCAPRRQVQIPLGNEWAGLGGARGKHC